ncbi:unnamed protein product [Rotaria sordida]|uniref:Uncharacterized protein n=1 Tax=Rotaria sordida TaxID=392033 RepID=A0A814V0A2_9BILA|nr:unnamed protein product [Rotaria sordida]CAF1116988.1 unnamed protein product [Rotaria sordida]CAF1182234.1 unnamed protein product [Rotaria sordida]CAF3924973.1 unnamed protein product [Rotaria sordida]
MDETINYVMSSIINETPTISSDNYIKSTSIDPSKHMIDDESKKESEACSIAKQSKGSIKSLTCPRCKQTIYISY